jgi:hypothetical protein
MTKKQHRRGAPPPPEVRDAIRALLQKHGPTTLSRRLGMSRDALAALAGDLPVLAGTVALARERLKNTAAEAAAAEVSP